MGPSALQLVVLASGHFKAGDAVGTSPLANIQGPTPPGSNSPALHVIPPLACSFEMHLATGCALQTTILV